MYMCVRVWAHMCVSVHVCVSVCVRMCEASESGVPHFSSSHVDAVSTARLCAGVARGAQLLSSPGTPLLKGKESSPSDHDGPGVRECGHQ